jgi:hypothetical protein
MNKLKPYQEPESTQAYALQILACHILEAEIRAKQNQSHERINTTQPQDTSFPHNDGETILTTETTPYPDRETLEAEDLEIHQVMLESYFVHPSIPANDGGQHQNHEVPNSPSGSKFSLESQTNCEPLGKSKPMSEESIEVQTFPEKMNPTPPRLKAGQGEATP